MGAGARAALTGEPAVAVHHFEQMTQPTLTRLAAYDRLDIAVRTGHLDIAGRWLAELEQFAAAVDTPHADAVVAYGRAVLASADSTPTAEQFFTLALGSEPGQDRPFERARTHLAYGEFLRRSRRRVDAREQLRSALQTFHDLDADPWVQRAEQELRASGETARKRHASTSVTLTAQEKQVATFIAEGLSNREVAAKLFLSPRTIDFHLRNISPRRGSPHAANSPGSPSDRPAPDRAPAVSRPVSACAGVPGRLRAGPAWPGGQPRPDQPRSPPPPGIRRRSRWPLRWVC